MRPRYTFKRTADAIGALRLAKELERREGWSRDRLEAYQRERLGALVRHAVDRSAFYRERFAGLDARGEIDLQALPALDKATMMENFDRLVTDDRLRLAEIERHLASLESDAYHLGEYRAMTTGGTTGRKGVFVFGRREWSHVLASGLRLFGYMGITPRLPRRWRICLIGAPSPLHMTNRMAATLRLPVHVSHPLPVTMPIPRLVEELNAFQPELVSVFPSVASLLAEEQLAGRLRIAPSVVSTTSEVRTREMEERIRGAWCVEPFDAYGITEAGAAAADCDRHKGFHFSEDLSILEVVDEENRPVPAGTPGAKYLLTNLFNYTQPLIRYEMSDIFTLSPEPCPCGRPFRLVSAIEGRSDDILRLPGPAGEVAVHPLNLRSPMAAIAEVRQYQIVHDPSLLEVRVLAREGISRNDVSARIGQALRENITALDASPPEIRVEFVDDFERDAAMGKFKIVQARDNGPAKVAAGRPPVGA